MSTDDEMRNNEANEMEEERWRQFLDVPDDDGPPIHRTTVEEARWRQYLDVPDDEQAGTLTEGLGRVDEDEVREGRRRLLLLVEQRRQAPPVGRSAYERSLAYERALAGLSPRDAAQHELWRQGLDADTPLAHMLGLPGRERAAEQRRQALQDWDEPQPEAPVWLVYLGGLWTWAGSLALASAPVLALVLPLLWLAFG